MIKINNIIKKYKNISALSDISCNMSKGEIIGLVGPNGAGKTTLMKIITGVIYPTSGNILINDKEIIENDDFKKIIGYMPENSALYDDMTPNSYLNFIAQARNIPKENISDAVSNAISMTQLQDVENQKIQTLSKGFKRRVSLAQAIIHNPEILILDEPTEGLDPNQKQEFYSLIKKFYKEKLIIISTHVLDEIHHCSKVLLINQGKIIIDDYLSNIKLKNNESLSDFFHRLTIKENCCDSNI